MPGSHREHHRIAIEHSELFQTEKHLRVLPVLPMLHVIGKLGTLLQEVGQELAHRCRPTVGLPVFDVANLAEFHPFERTHSHPATMSDTG